MVLQQFKDGAPDAIQVMSDIVGDNSDRSATYLWHRFFFVGGAATIPLPPLPKKHKSGVSEANLCVSVN